MSKAKMRTVGLVLCLLLPVLANGQEKKAVSAIIVDNTGSMRTQLEYVLAISGQAGELLSRRGLVSIFSFKFHLDGKKELGSLNSGSAWLSDRKKLWEKINAIKIEPGQTQLIDALDIARSVVASRVTSDHFDEGIIFIVTDGDDRASDVKVKNLIESLKRDHIKVFSIGLVDQLWDGKKKATQLLKRITSETGGSAVFPKSEELQTMKTFEPMITQLFAPPAISK
jgi:hypothetical protein